MKTAIVLSLASSAIFLGGCSLLPSSDMDTAMMKQDEPAMIKQDEPAMIKQDEPAMMKQDPAEYSTYSEAAVTSALNAGKSVALFFHAPRCPSCKSLDSDLTSNISSMPENTVVFKVDYDTSTELKKKYGITQQHTVVRIDRNNELLSKKIGASREDVISLFK